ncbi:MAG TPA: NAD(P)/FAD-dependent oxidoreductase [Thermoanaerobaculia bacterium]
MQQLDLPEADAFVVGSGPNGLSAAIVLAQAGLRVAVLEREASVGGSCRTEALTAPGFRHDVCSAVFPLAAASPFFRSLPLERHGLEWVRSPACLAHPFDDGTAALLWPSLERTAEELGAPRYRRLLGALLPRADVLFGDLLGPPHLPSGPAAAMALARFGALALRSGETAARRLSRLSSDGRGDRARGLFAGLFAHSMLRLDAPMSAAAGLLLALAAHSAGWPLAKGGAQAVTGSLAAHLRSLGGVIRTSVGVESLSQLPATRVVVCDLTPRQLVRIGEDRLDAGFAKSLERYRYGLAAFKLDWALDRPIPWTARACAEAATVHLGGSLEEIAESERAAWEGAPSPRPFVLLSQPSLFDASRAPAGAHTAWAYAHVPNGYSGEAAERIEEQVERFAPGFRRTVIARSVLSPSDLEAHNPNLVGGDISGGLFDLGQAFLRPTARLYGTSEANLFLCSASTPPGPGVHGMCGYHAAKAALASLQ